jgi:hypothetical protein
MELDAIAPASKSWSEKDHDDGYHGDKTQCGKFWRTSALR